MPCKFTVVTGLSGAGKSFTGDYLATYCGFAHIDGDARLHAFHVPENEKLAEGLGEAAEYWTEDKEAPKELWEPYFEALCNDALQAAGDSEKVVLTFSIYRRQQRDFIREKLGSDDVTFVKLECDVDALVRGLFLRQASVPGAEARWKERNEEPFCEESFKKKVLASGRLKGFEPIAADEPSTFVVDTTARDASTLDQLHQALGLPARTEDVDPGRIADIDQARVAAHFR